MSKPHVYRIKTTNERRTIDYKRSAKFQWECSKDYKLYAFSVKVLHNSKKADEKTYEPFFNNLFARTQVICYCPEISPHEVLHYHGAIKVRKSFNLKLIRVKGFHLYLKVCYNFKNWADYCFKNNIYYNYSYLTGVHRLI